MNQSRQEKRRTATGSTPERALAPAKPPPPAPLLTERQLKYVRIGAPLLVFVAAILAGVIFGPPMTALVLAGGTLAGAIAVFWGSIRALFGELPLTGEEAFALAAPSAEEEQKRAVLRAIKDLEFEHGVGKISDEDYDVLMEQYRSQAKRLLRTIDEQARPERDRVQKLVDEHLRKVGLAAAEREAEIADDAHTAFQGGAPPFAAAPADGEAPPEAAREHDTASVARKAVADVASGAALPRRAAKRKRRHERARAEAAMKGGGAGTSAGSASVSCPACNIANDPDARFCKRCGGPLAASASDTDQHEES